MKQIGRSMFLYFESKGKNPNFLADNGSSFLIKLYLNSKDVILIGSNSHTTIRSDEFSDSSTQRSIQYNHPDVAITLSDILEDSPHISLSTVENLLPPLDPLGN